MTIELGNDDLFCEPDPQPEEFDPPSTQTECVKCKEKFWAMDRYTNICEDCFGKL